MSIYATELGGMCKHLIRLIFSHHMIEKRTSSQKHCLMKHSRMIPVIVWFEMFTIENYKAIESSKTEDKGTVRLERVLLYIVFISIPNIPLEINRYVCVRMRVCFLKLSLN